MEKGYDICFERGAYDQKFHKKKRQARSSKSKKREGD